MFGESGKLLLEIDQELTRNPSTRLRMNGEHLAKHSELPFMLSSLSKHSLVFLGTPYISA
jgi:hypothetical protein